MLKLIRLEWKKNNTRKYILKFLLLNACLCLFLFGLLFWGMAVDPDTGMVNAPTGYDIISPFIELLSNMTYICFSGSMLASFIVSSYKNKTIGLMFSYPIKRQKILVSQMLAVWIFSFGALVFTKLFLYFSVLAGSLYMPPDFRIDFDIRSVDFYLHILISSAVMVSLSFISLYVGLKMRSSKATVLSSVVLMFLTQGNIGDFSLANNVVFFIILLALSLVFAVLSIYKVEMKDLL